MVVVVMLFDCFAGGDTWGELSFGSRCRGAAKALGRVGAADDASTGS